MTEFRIIRPIERRRASKHQYLMTLRPRFAKFISAIRENLKPLGGLIEYTPFKPSIPYYPWCQRGFRGTPPWCRETPESLIVLFCRVSRSNSNMDGNLRGLSPHYCINNCRITAGGAGCVKDAQSHSERLACLLSSCTQRYIFQIISNQPEIRLYLPISGWFNKIWKIFLCVWGTDTYVLNLHTTVFFPKLFDVYIFFDCSSVFFGNFFPPFFLSSTFTFFLFFKFCGCQFHCG